MRPKCGSSPPAHTFRSTEVHPTPRAAGPPWRDGAQTILCRRCSTELAPPCAMRDPLSRPEGRWGVLGVMLVNDFCQRWQPAPTDQSSSPPPTSPPRQPPQPLPLPLHSSPLSPRAGIAAATAQPSGAACGVMWPTGKSASPVPSSGEALSVGRAPAPGSVGMRGVPERGRPPQSQVHTRHQRRVQGWQAKVQALLAGRRRRGSGGGVEPETASTTACTAHGA